MGVADLDTKVALAESTRSYDACVELLQYVRKEKLRVPRVVAKFGKLLIQSHSWRLGSDSTFLHARVACFWICGGVVVVAGVLF